MEDNSNFKVFLLINLNKIAIHVKNDFQNKIIYENEKIFNDKVNILDINEVQIFLDDQIFLIEKILKNFINRIYLILESEKFLNIDLCLKKENHNNFIEKESVNNLINDARSLCKKTTENRKIIHLVIDSYLIEEKKFSNFPSEIKCDNFCISLRIICISNSIIKQLDKILEKYQISISRYFSYDYLKSHKFLKSEVDIYEVAEKIIDKKNPNEVELIKKNHRNRGFFEKFFFIFN